MANNETPKPKGSCVEYGNPKPRKDSGGIGGLATVGFFSAVAGLSLGIMLTERAATPSEIFLNDLNGDSNPELVYNAPTGLTRVYTQDPANPLRYRPFKKVLEDETRMMNQQAREIKLKEIYEEANKLFK